MTDIFITEDFLLQNEKSVELYHAYAEGLPIIDYHCHLPPREVAEDRRFENLTRIWLAGDHYKWRLMRAAGVEERLCTGNASDWEKFHAWAATTPRTLCNPVYHWTHLELKRYFGISGRLLNGQTARDIWEECNAKLASSGFSARGIMDRMKVKAACTTDDPTDGLEHHAAIAADKSFAVKVYPAFRPDKALAVESSETFNAWLDRLQSAANVEIRNLVTFIEALHKRHDFFHKMGCRLSDHGLETVPWTDYTEAEFERIFRKVRGGAALAPDEIAKFKSAMLEEFAVLDAQRGWTQQFHLGALRNVNSRMLKLAGPDSGFDTIGDFEIARPLARLLDRLDSRGMLPKTILYNLNPRDNMALAAMTGSFQDGSASGKIQFGGGWWFLDQKDGMEDQMRALSNTGLLSCFVGMTTDSRSFMSYPRHEYFRRILCNFLGGQMQKGLLPDDMKLVGRLVRDVCFNNAARYFGFEI